MFSTSRSLWLAKVLQEPPPRLTLFSPAPAGTTTLKMGDGRLVGLASSSPDVQDQADRCNVNETGGTWRYIGNITDSPSGGSGVARDAHLEHLLRWAPAAQDGDGCRYHRFSQEEALRCLANKTLVFFGNSNTRTLFIALESLLRNTPMMSRTAAKQLCDNSRTNHHCWTTIPIDESVSSLVTLKYFSYTKGLYDEELPRKLAQEEGTEHDGGRPADVVIGNSGLNSIQNFDDRVWEREHEASVPKMSSFIESILRDPRRNKSYEGTARCDQYNKSESSRPVFVWHLTTPVCENQPHFRRYRYNAKHWRYRSIETINKAVERSNAFATRSVNLAAESSTQRGGASCGGRVMVLDGWSMLAKSAMISAAGGSDSSRRTRRDVMKDLCPYFDDPLHHRFMDREMVQLLLNKYCR